MSQVDFYLLPDQTSAARWSFACKLLEKVVRLNFQAHVILNSKESFQEFSHLLWSFKPESFLPHMQLGPQQTRPLPCPITVSSQDDLPTWTQLAKPDDKQFLLLNLSDHPLSAQLEPLLPHCDRIAEIVIQEENCLKITRGRYKNYQQRGIAIETRKIESAQ